MGSNEIDRVTAVILAGGQSRRMGTDKAAIALHGVPLIRRVYDVAAACAGAVAVLSPWGDRYRSMLPPACQFIRETVTEGQPHGPLVAFAQVWDQVGTDWVLLLACDLPYLTVPVVQGWVSQALAAEAEVENTVPIAYLCRHPKGWNPLCGLYHRRSQASLTAYIHTAYIHTPYIHRGGRSFQGWLAEQPVAELTLSDAQVLFNCNTPADLLRVQ